MQFVHDSKYGQKAAQWGQRICLRKREYPVIDKLVMAYVAVMLLFQIFFQISPIVTFLATTPLYSAQTYLGLLGGGLIVLDLFTTKRIWQGKFSILLYAILLLAALASLRMISYGMKENLFKLCWAGIQFVLVYSCVYRTDRASIKKYVKILFYVLLVIWLVACCISLYQYVNQIGYRYVVNPLAKDASSNRQGFYDNRLFGIFYTLNHAAYISLYFLLITVVCIFREKNIWTRVCLILAAFVLLSYILLSGSRSTLLSLIVCAAVLAWFLVRNAIRKKGFVKVSLPVVVALLTAVACLAVCFGLKQGLARIPYLKSLNAYYQQVHEEHGQDIKKPEFDEELLVREGLDKEGVSNGRISIWKDYISLYKEVGVVGLSPGNYMPYILDNFPELYIVDYIRAVYPDKYESGIIYHVHSGYMMVYVSTGVLGLLCLLMFMLLCIVKTIRMIRGNNRLSYFYIGAFLLVVAGAISAALDEGLFFQNMPHTTMFWFALGIAMTGHLSAKGTSEDEPASN